MTDLGVQDAAAKADHMVNPASLAASMIDERAPDIVEALNDTPPELAVAVLLHLPPDRAIEVLHQPGLEREPEIGKLFGASLGVVHRPVLDNPVDQLEDDRALDIEL